MYSRYTGSGLVGSNPTLCNRDARVVKGEHLRCSGFGLAGSNPAPCNFFICFTCLFTSHHYNAVHIDCLMNLHKLARTFYNISQMPISTPSSSIVPVNQPNHTVTKHTVTQKEDAIQEGQVDHTDNEALCMICLEPLYTSIHRTDTSPTVPLVHIIDFDCSCSHQAIHPKCLQQWYIQNGSCPICRQRDNQPQSVPSSGPEYSSYSPPLVYHLEVSKLYLRLIVFFLLIVCIVIITVGRYLFLVDDDGRA